MVNTGTTVLTFLMDFGFLGGLCALLVRTGFTQQGQPVLMIHGYLWHIGMLALAAYMIYVRFQLAGFRIDAPRKLSILYCANLGCSVVYLLAVSAVTKLSLGSMMGDIAGTVFGSILMLFINQNYYNKRLELFVN